MDEGLGQLVCIWDISPYFFSGTVADLTFPSQANHGLEKSTRVDMHQRSIDYRIDVDFCLKRI